MRYPSDLLRIAIFKSGASANEVGGKARKRRPIHKETKSL